MLVAPTELPGVLLLHTERFRDHRGWVSESYRASRLPGLGIPDHFAQENTSWSEQGVLRGLHFQEREPQGKLITVHRGAIRDVAVDLRPDSPTHGQWTAVTLQEADGVSLWVPPGCAHGFYVLQGPAIVSYKLTAEWAPQWDRCLAWDDPTLAIDWQLTSPPVLSDRDRQGLTWAQAAALDVGARLADQGPR
ncbi:MAG: dTDP-4-dehydrorhamnose 3,5-epimerase [Alphaproteobacteria bacterium]|nr:dTDP-4-dehydrorhamnose 3,5-epimerase [Alphaproteobacteria bacterium]